MRRLSLAEQMPVELLEAVFEYYAEDFISPNPGEQDASLIGITADCIWSQTTLSIQAVSATWRDVAARIDSLWTIGVIAPSADKPCTCNVPFVLPTIAPSAGGKGMTWDAFVALHGDQVTTPPRTVAQALSTLDPIQHCECYPLHVRQMLHLRHILAKPFRTFACHFGRARSSTNPSDVLDPNFGYAALAYELALESQRWRSAYWNPHYLRMIDDALDPRKLANLRHLSVFDLEGTAGDFIMAKSFIHAPGLSSISLGVSVFYRPLWLPLANITRLRFVETLPEDIELVFRSLPNLKHLHWALDGFLGNTGNSLDLVAHNLEYMHLALPRVPAIENNPDWDIIAWRNLLSAMRTPALKRLVIATSNMTEHSPRFPLDCLNTSLRLSSASLEELTFHCIVLGHEKALFETFSLCPNLKVLEIREHCSPYQHETAVPSILTASLMRHLKSEVILPNLQGLSFRAIDGNGFAEDDPDENNEYLDMVDSLLEAARRMVDFRRVRALKWWNIHFTDDDFYRPREKWVLPTGREFELLEKDADEEEDWDEDSTMDVGEPEDVKMIDD